MTNPETIKTDFDIDLMRASIDEIDTELLDLINKRLLLAKHIGAIKKQKGENVLDPARESNIINRLLSLNKGPLSKKALHHIFAEIISSSREVQKKETITYLGPEATFTHIAAMNHFGHTVSFVPQTSIRDIFGEVEKGACTYGVVPVENSIEGTVNYTLDLFFESNLKICAEIYHTISHDLLSKTGRLEDIRVIYSHPHVFPQCRKWIGKHLPDIVLEECSSTARAAQKALENPVSAAIASSEAAQMYGLNVVASRIEDFSRNVTRFLVIGHDDIHRTGNDKTSIMFVTAHIPGALYKSLAPIAESGINMVKLESRPTKYENWNYFFFVDLEGHIEDPNVKETVDKMKKLCMYIKYLGSYPRAKR